MKKLKLWAGLVIIFLSGVMIGGMGAWMVAEHRAVDTLTRGRPDVPRFIIERLASKLDLDEGQKERVAEIVCRAHSELMEFRKLHKSEKDQIIQRSITSIKAELSPEQQKKLDILHARMEERRARRESWAQGRNGGAGPCR